MSKRKSVIKRQVRFLFSDQLVIAGFLGLIVGLFMGASSTAVLHAINPDVSAVTLTVSVLSFLLGSGFIAYTVTAVKVWAKA